MKRTAHQRASSSCAVRQCATQPRAQDPKAALHCWDRHGYQSFLEAKWKEPSHLLPREACGRLVSLSCRQEVWGKTSDKPKGRVREGSPGDKPKNSSKRGWYDSVPQEETGEGELYSGESVLAPGLSLRPLTSLFPKSIQNTE